MIPFGFEWVCHIDIGGDGVTGPILGVGVGAGGPFFGPGLSIPVF